MKEKGLKIKAGYDLDGSCKYAYEVNNSVTFHYQDIKSDIKSVGADGYAAFSFEEDKNRKEHYHI